MNSCQFILRIDLSCFLNVSYICANCSNNSTSECKGNLYIHGNMEYGRRRAGTIMTEFWFNYLSHKIEINNLCFEFRFFILANNQ